MYPNQTLMHCTQNHNVLHRIYVPDTSLQAQKQLQLAVSIQGDVYTLYTTPFALKI